MGKEMQLRHKPGIEHQTFWGYFDPHVPGILQ